MTNQKIIICAFCQGTGKHPHFTGSCPVCKGRGKNQAISKFMTCPDCHGTGQKGGTTLTCFSCGGLGVVPDTREEFKQAREEIRKAQEEIEIERPARQRPEPQVMAGGEELRKKPSALPTEEEDEPEEDEKGRCFCQACANKIDRDSTLKVCLKCFKKIKKKI